MNQTPEQIARDKIDDFLISAGWVVQSKNMVNLSANKGVAVREYQTDAGPADYVLFVNCKTVGVIETKASIEDQWSVNKPKYLNNYLLIYVRGNIKV